MEEDKFFIASTDGLSKLTKRTQFFWIEENHRVQHGRVLANKGANK